ncbi:RebB family R body protein [Maricaulis sp.]|uniref:RebB family R body protein n=1 Tax=Maricaulis sp. TaxID=1486257 RepID=UPI0025BDDBB5|nr:RebB family R body protein [Maricaulis sp.]
MADRKTTPSTPTADQQAEAGTLTINPAVTDSVTQANIKVLGDAPAEAMGTIYQTVSQSTGIALEDIADYEGSLAEITSGMTADGIKQVLQAGAESANQPATSHAKSPKDTRETG